MAVVPECPSLQPKGSPGCGQSARTPWWGEMLFPTPTVLPQHTQKLFKQVLLEKIGKNMLCVQYTVLAQTRSLLSSDLLCFHSFWSATFTEVSIYILKDTHMDFFFFFLIRKMLCCYYLIFFSLQVQEFFVLLGTTFVLCCLIKVSKMMIFLLLWFLLAWIWHFFHTSLGFWCHLSNPFL